MPYPAKVPYRTTQVGLSRDRRKLSSDGAGLQRATAYRLAAKMVEGVGALYMATGTHPGAMKDAVCSPGGTTIRGVAKLEKDGFRGAVIDAVDAIVG